MLTILAVAYIVSVLSSAVLCFVLWLYVYTNSDSTDLERLESRQLLTAVPKCVIWPHYVMRGLVRMIRDTLRLGRDDDDD